MRSFLLLVAAVIVTSFTSRPTQAQECEICREPLLAGLVNKYKYKSAAWNQQEATRFFCSDEFEKGTDNRSSGLSVGIPIDGVPFKLDSTDAQQRFREARKSACGTKRDFASTTDLQEILVEDTSGAFDAYKLCVAECYRSRAAVSGRWESSNAQTANARLSYQPNTNGAPAEAVLTGFRPIGLACNRIRAIPSTGAVIDCTWAADAKGCGQLTVTTTQGDWIGIVARPIIPQTAQVTESVPFSLRRDPSHASVIVNYTTARCKDCPRIADRLSYTVTFNAERGYVLDPPSPPTNPSKVYCRGGTLRCSGDFLQLINPMLSEGGRSAHWTVLSRSEPADLRLEWRQSQPIQAHRRQGSKIDLGASTTRVAFPVAAGADGGSVTVAWNDGKVSSFTLGELDSLGRLQYESRHSTGTGTTFIYKVLPPSCKL